jgi:hypothetical protein
MGCPTRLQQPQALVPLLADPPGSQVSGTLKAEKCLQNFSMGSYIDRSGWAWKKRRNP